MLTEALTNLLFVQCPSLSTHTNTQNLKKKEEGKFCSSADNKDETQLDKEAILRDKQKIPFFD